MTDAPTPPPNSPGGRPQSLTLGQSDAAAQNPTPPEPPSPQLPRHEARPSDLGGGIENPLPLPHRDTEDPDGSNDASGGGGDLREQIIASLKEVYDPEIPVNIYDLGLIYKIDIADDRSVAVEMTLTSPACPVAGELPGQVRQAVERVRDVKTAEVDLVFDPPWSMEKMSDEAKIILDMM